MSGFGGIFQNPIFTLLGNAILGSLGRDEADKASDRNPIASSSDRFGLLPRPTDRITPGKDAITPGKSLTTRDFLNPNTLATQLIKESQMFDQAARDERDRFLGEAESLRSGVERRGQEGREAVSRFGLAANKASQTLAGQRPYVDQLLKLGASIPSTIATQARDAMTEIRGFVAQTRATGNEAMKEISDNSAIKVAAFRQGIDNQVKQAKDQFSRSFDEPGSGGASYWEKKAGERLIDFQVSLPVAQAFTQFAGEESQRVNDAFIRVNDTMTSALNAAQSSTVGVLGSVVRGVEIGANVSTAAVSLSESLVKAQAELDSTNALNRENLLLAVQSLEYTGEKDVANYIRNISDVVGPLYSGAIQTVMGEFQALIGEDNTIAEQNYARDIGAITALVTSLSNAISGSTEVAFQNANLDAQREASRDQLIGAGIGAGGGVAGGLLGNPGLF